MRKIIQYISGYISWIDKKLFFLSSLFTAALIFINYRFHLNGFISDLSFPLAFLSWTLVFLVAFSFAYIWENKSHQSYFRLPSFRRLLLFACMLFAWKISFPVNIHMSENAVMNEYWNAVVYWPVKLFFVTGCLYIIWKRSKDPQPFYGTGIQQFHVMPYLLMLIVMVPLISLAATRPEFLQAYPRYENIELLKNYGTQAETLLFELSYGSDFITIELFFRGFLVLAFSRWAGRGAILPMAMFYCTIHFGKPLGECISSFFGGLLLGIVSYHSKTIWGGLMVHLGIAWLMELAAHLAGRM